MESIKTVEELAKARFVKNGVTIPFMESKVNRGPTAGTVVYVLNLEGITNDTYTKLLGEEKVQEIFSSYVGSRSVAANSAAREDLNEDPTDKTKVTGTKFHPEQVILNLDAYLSPAGPPIGELRALKAELQTQYDPIIAELTPLLIGGQSGSPKAIELLKKLKPLSEQMTKVTEQIALTSRS